MRQLTPEQKETIASLSKPSQIDAKVADIVSLEPLLRFNLNIPQPKTGRSGGAYMVPWIAGLPVEALSTN